MPHRWTPITTIRELEAAIGGPTEQPVIVFQHDPFCPTSRRAYQQLTRVNQPIVIVNVSQDDVVKRAIARRTGIRHESPHVIVFKQGTACWSASHSAITQQAVEQALVDHAVRDEDQHTRER